MASARELDFGLTTTKKKTVTYGKAARRRPQAPTDSTPAALRHAESAPPVFPTSSSSHNKLSSSPDPTRPAPSARTLVSSKSRLNTRRTGDDTASKPAGESSSQPLHDPYDIYAIEDDEPEKEEVRPRKRRLARGYSEKVGKTTIGPYSTPDSSPTAAQSPEPNVPRSVPKENPPSTSESHGTPEKDIQMQDAPQSAEPLFSVKTTKILKNLSVGAEKPTYGKAKIPIRLSRAPSVSSRPAIATEPVSLPTVKERPQNTSQATYDPPSKGPRKRRLIDTLAAQADGEEETSDEEEPSSQNSHVSNSRRSPAFRESSPQASSTLDEPRKIARPVLAAKQSGPKFTYSQQRSMLEEEDALFPGGGLGGLDADPTKGALFNFGRLTKSATMNAFSYLDEDDETRNTGAVRSVHELRQAGANSRFADEMDDILDRIGNPSAKASSLRRGALLELAQKMKTKEFRRQFRDHSGDGALFKALGDELDVVCGFSIVAIITTLLAASTSGHLILQLRSQGIATLLRRLLEQPVDIAQMAKDRKQNLSKTSQTTVGAIKASLQELPVWKPISPTSLSPRTLALQCLGLLMRQFTPGSEDELMPIAVTDLLISILADGASDSASWNFPNQPESCDFYLALHIIEGYSAYAMQSSRLGPRWTRQYAPVVADVLKTSLSRPVDKLDELESLTLRISLNVTNHNKDACQLFVERGLLGRLVETACGGFNLAVRPTQGDALVRILDHLIMLQGVMINFCVYYPPASQTLEASGDGAGSPLNQLIRIFADNHTKTGDADSMEKTHLNVALGYLSVFLGYLCLHDSIRERFIKTHPKKHLLPLLESVNEFIALHHKAAEAQGNTESSSIPRLQNLADQLNTAMALRY
ncbi:wings apart-like protein 1 [Podospora australis]|uniref:Wings apart-like protein 1 n=1 Tax=Podospora australis TaxID=1536484 RepID=A0AAN6X6L3_9PEZI|nr:wings apart-like protein 1 [Podospora australis]